MIMGFVKVLKFRLSFPSTQTYQLHHASTHKKYGTDSNFKIRSETLFSNVSLNAYGSDWSSNVTTFQTVFLWKI